MSTKPILILNGPNINMLGKRDKDIYGSRTYAELCAYIKDICPEAEILQSNHEGELIDVIQTADEKYSAAVINAGGYSHTSIAIADAVADSGIPFFEVHLSDISRREEFRRRSFLTAVCEKTFMGKGFESYKEALLYIKGEVK